ncbi:MAG: SH3 domain-containing protein [Pseudomonadota bacterium]
MKRIAQTIAVALLATAAHTTVQPAMAQSAITGSTAVDARMRAGPGTRHRIVDGVRAGDVLRNVRETGIYHNGYQWLVVTYRGQVGYVWGAMVCTSYYLPGSQQCNNRQQANRGNTQNTSHGSGGQQFVNVVDYSCGPQEMPMTVIYKDEGNESVAYVTHDGGYQVRLVKPWGANGDQYFKDNSQREGIYGRGNRMVYAMDGLEQNCFSN